MKGCPIISNQQGHCQSRAEKGTPRIKTFLSLRIFHHIFLAFFIS
jgi:hypothetical protein